MKVRVYVNVTELYLKLVNDRGIELVWDKIRIKNVKISADGKKLIIELEVE